MITFGSVSPFTSVKASNNVICSGAEQAMNYQKNLKFILTSDLLFNVLLFGLSKTSLKSNLISLITLGIIAGNVLNDIHR